MNIMGVPNYRDIDWDALAAAEAIEREEHPDLFKVISSPPTTLVKAIGGPFDGMELNVPPGGSEVLLPAAYGDGDMKGKVIYRRIYTADGSIMKYMGQPEQRLDEEDGDDGVPPQLLRP